MVLSLRILIFSALLLPLSLLAADSLPAGEAGTVPLRTAEGFAVPQPGSDLPFPRSHAAHPDYRIEWWYLTGHLFTAEGRRFGYQATFFRYGRRPQSDPATAFGTDQLHLTHMALTDVESEDFHYESRLQREGWDAAASTQKLHVRNGNWSLRTLDPDVTEMELQASARGRASWRLRLTPAKPLVRFGPDGTSRKGPHPAARSFYLSFTRLQTSGTLTLDGTTYKVSGSSWMDHEIASRQLDPSYEGWDWIAIQLRDGWEMKAYLLREEDGSPSPFSALIWIDPSGNLRYRSADGFSWESVRSFTSEATGATWPAWPVIQTVDPRSGQPAEFRFQPVLPDQELDLPGTTYWEGAGDVTDAAGNLLGRAYLELVGYAGPIEGLR